MKLTTTTNVTVDGVMQGLGGPDEDRSGGFDRGGWAIPSSIPKRGLSRPDLRQRGRVPLWPADVRDLRRLLGNDGDPSTNPIAAALNSRPKYVASSHLTDPPWAGTTVLTGDLVTAIRDLKTHHDGELLVPGSGVLVRWLLANDLVDQLDLVIYPVVVGKGTRLFPESGPDLALDLVASRHTARGITIQTYRPAGRPTYVTSTLDPADVAQRWQ